MKRSATIIALVLLFSLVLSSCGHVALLPAEKAAETLKEAAQPVLSAVQERAQGFVLQPLASSNKQVVTTTTVKTDMFRAKFEGNAVAGSGEAVDGVYRFTATQTDGEAWVEQLLWYDPEGGIVYSMAVFTADPGSLDIEGVAEKIMGKE